MSDQPRLLERVKWSDVAAIMAIAVAVDFLFQSEKSLDKRSYMALGIAFGYSGGVGLLRWILARRSSGTPP